MKNQQAILFPELITSLDYVNPITKKLFPHHLKNTPLAGRITNFVSKLTNDKDILQIVKGLKIPFLERPSQKQPPTEIKMSQEENKLVDTEVQELLRKGTITPAGGSKDQFVSNIFSETEKIRSFSPDYKFEKMEPIHSIFAFQNGKPKTTKRSSKAKRSNGKNRSQRRLLQHSPASRNTEVCKVSRERESIPISMSVLVWDLLPGSSPKF